MITHEQFDKISAVASLMMKKDIEENNLPIELYEDISTATAMFVIQAYENMKVKDDEKEIIPDEEIEKVHASASFAISKRKVVSQGLLKCASGLYQGGTSKQILKEHSLITDNYKLTFKGKKYLWAAFKDEISV